VDLLLPEFEECRLWRYWLSPRSRVPRLFLSARLLLFSLSQHPPAPPLHPMDPHSKDSIETADHFIYVTQVYFCGTYSFHLTIQLLELIRGFYSHVYSANSFSVLSHFFWHTSFWPIDAVVLWDWIISLPREYRFVRSPHASPSLSLLTFYLGMENSLDSSQDSVSLLPVS